MTRYPALIDGKKSAYGLTFPDLPGIVAMGKTLDEVMVNAEYALHDCAIEAKKDGETMADPSVIDDIDAPAGQVLVSIPLIHLSGRSVRANLNLDEDVAAFIDSEARRRGMTRTAYVSWMTRRIAQMGG